jgi:light-regulated signal transduction histidine kinase (bacteriophytochrome)
VTTSALTPLRALLLEDNQDDTVILGRHLKRGGYEAELEQVETADAFERALDRGGWDVVFADYVLPGYSGLAALNEVQRRELDIPFIIVSGKIGEETAVEAMRAGAHDYLMKSNLARLGPVVERELREAHRRQDRRRAQEQLAMKSAALAERTLELERSNLELEEFAYIASHDLSAPLRVIAGNIGLFVHRHCDSVDEPATLLLDSAFRGTERMQRLIDDLLLYSLASRGPLNLVDVDTADVIRDVMEDYSTQIADTKAEIEIGPMPHVHSVYAPLSQVLHNLVGNALKFTNGSPPHIEISACELHARWCLSVRDNGIGIEPRHVETAFRMFQRLHGAKYPGTGMGLALSKRVVQRLGGEIWHEPAPSGGSIFFVTIPADERTSR